MCCFAIASVAICSHEDDGLINRKLKAALRHGLTPVLSVGEHADERDAGRMREFMKRFGSGG